MSSQEVRRTDGDEFAAVLHQSILREQARAAAEPSNTYVQPQTYAQQQQPTAMRSTVRQEMPQQRSPIPVPPAPTARPAVPASPSPQLVPTEEADEPVREDETIIKARALLRAGRTIEQVARETGVEIGALRLMKQMTQRD